MINSTPLKYPKKSHRKAVRLPEESSDLAEFFGIMMGDGGINNTWQADISLNFISDAEYATYISALCERLFGIKPTFFKKRLENTLVLKLSSISIVNFLVEKGLPRGNKLKAGLQIPQWILEDKTYSKACVRGLVDTDGCLYIHVHNSKWDKVYRNLGFCFTSYSPKLIQQMADILSEYDITPHISKRGTDIYLYKVSSIEKYLTIFNTSNDRIISIYHKWRGRIVV